MSVRSSWHNEPERKAKNNEDQIRIQYFCSTCGSIGGGWYKRIPRKCRVCGGDLTIIYKGAYK